LPLASNERQGWTGSVDFYRFQGNNCPDLPYATRHAIFPFKALNLDPDFADSMQNLRMVAAGEARFQSRP
jgi:hypothetical protein